MRWAVIGLGVLLGGAGLVAWWQYGALPESYKVARAARYNQLSTDVFAVLTDIGASTSWRSDLASVERLPDTRGHEVWREVSKDGTVVVLETVEVLPDRRQIRCVIEGPFGGCFTIEMVARDKEGASMVTRTEALRYKDSSYRFFHTRAGRVAGLERFLNDLGAHFGETPIIAEDTRTLSKQLRDAEAAAAPPTDAPADAPPADAPPANAPTF